MSRLGEVVGRLEAVIEARRDANPETSWTARLLQDGPPRAARKLGEEAVEAIVAAVSGDRDGLAAEAADVLYHLLVLLAAAGVSPDEVAARLEAREGASGLEEKAARGQAGS
ncbi:phosphoribosyl-ATP diphosphatase [Phenylobacterium sp.]|uniref:phosphoribosyl-ATP diphosphatase n=1 Tax=Phenylobacterium sp. TaxID=1871053 RepID=UPI0025F2E5CF|nr:phosphoribosyl-ATP diphosphatase [Phenylobacterium sp.]MCA3745596.1 phosphoribosyl-ATP diphosphatase [Phenylobacterium sp.]MCA3750064.1 phosphoribosyl-ATP diphosphatase [Phenylobacterium sp.]